MWKEYLCGIEFLTGLWTSGSSIYGEVGVIGGKRRLFPQQKCANIPYISSKSKIPGTSLNSAIRISATPNLVWNNSQEELLESTAAPCVDRVVIRQPKVTRILNVQVSPRDALLSLFPVAELVLSSRSRSAWPGRGRTSAGASHFFSLTLPHLFCIFSPHFWQKTRNFNSK